MRLRNSQAKLTGWTNLVTIAILLLFLSLTSLPPRVRAIDYPPPPYGIAVNPVTGMVYVERCCYAPAGYVEVVNGTSGESVSNVTLGQPANGVAVDPARNRVYVISENLLTVLDGSTNKVIATLDLGSSLYGVAVDQVTGRVYVTACVVCTDAALGFSANARPGAVYAIDGPTDRLIANLSLGAAAFGVAVNPANGRVYVIDGKWGGNLTLSVIDGPANKVIGALKVGTDVPWIGVAVNPSNGQVYVGSCCQDSNGTVSVIDGSTDQFVKSVSVGAGEPSAIAVNPSNGRVYVTNTYTSVSVIDSKTDKVLKTISGQEGVYAVAVNPATGEAYSTTVHGVISAIDGQTTFSCTVGTPDLTGVPKPPSCTIGTPSSAENSATTTTSTSSDKLGSSGASPGFYLYLAIGIPIIVGAATAIVIARRGHGSGRRSA